MKRIICGTDFSIYAVEAADVAATLAKRNDATLALVHAVSPGELSLLKREDVDAIVDRRRRALMMEADRLRAIGANVVEKLVLGAPQDALASAATRLDADLIVISSLGEVSALRWIAGSVALGTARKATAPTLVVRDRDRLMAWANGERALEVHLCYDFSPAADAALRWVGSLAKWGSCNVTANYVSWPPQDAWRLGVTSEDPSVDTTPEVNALLERGLKEKCERMLGTVRPTIHVVPSWGRPDVCLNELATAAKADLVVVGTNRRNLVDRFWFGSVSRGVIRHSRNNVVCVPGAYVARNENRTTDDIGRVLVPIDFTEASEQAVGIAFGLAPVDAEVCLFHAVPETPVFGVRDETPPGETDSERKVRERLEALARKHRRGRRIRSRVEVVTHRHPATAICQAAERLNADLIYMASRGGSRWSRRLRQSVSDAVKRRSCRTVTVAPAG